MKKYLLLALVMCVTLFYGFAPVKAEQNLGLEGKAQILMDFETGEVLLENNAKSHLPIASVTKLTTLLLCLEALDEGRISLDEKVVASENAASMGGSQVFIESGGEYKVENLLRAIAIASANDASVVMAEKLAGSEESFVSIMNDRLVELGCEDTHYTNCTGLPSAEAFSCAFDVAKVLACVVTHPLYFEISKVWMEDFVHPNNRITQISNTNKLLKRYAFCDGGKTGSTSEAKFCMGATAKKGDMRLIGVVLGADNSEARFSSLERMFEWGFNSFVSRKIVDSQKSSKVDIRWGKTLLEIKPKTDYCVVEMKNENREYNVDYLMDNLSAPIKTGDKVGKVIVSKDNIVLAEIELVATNDVAELSVWQIFKKIT
ncbi:MAG: D-alanyl-D-alanine carboxypeptidase [Clostridia bacterium]|nr:D-alanyl-D-alanine carboxypeptidase [Clostridia bacterium]